MKITLEGNNGEINHKTIIDTEQITDISDKEFINFVNYAIKLYNSGVTEMIDKIKNHDDDLKIEIKTEKI